MKNVGSHLGPFFSLSWYCHHHHHHYGHLFMPTQIFLLTVTVNDTANRQ